jgi:prepilin-type N-terminal cleavage/methylation domain-containing protein
MRGFTLPELLIVTTLVAIFIGIGMPGMRTLHGNLATGVEQHRLVSLLKTARAAAIHRHRRTVVCPADAEEAELACGSAAGAGWLVFSDGNGDRRYSAADDELLRSERIPSTRALHVQDRNGEVFDDVLTFRPDGSVSTPATVQLCAGGSQRILRIVISMTGRVRTEREQVPCAV